MQAIVKSIHDIINGYRNEDNIFIQPEDIIEWGNQFGDDCEFVLTELHNLLQQTYFSKNDAINALRQLINGQYHDYGFSSADDFLKSTCFLRLQQQGKSQHIYLDLLDDIVLNTTHKHLCDYDCYPKTIFIYLDDILATGGTIRKDLINWLQADNHTELLRQRKIRLELSLICVHTWGLQFLLYGLRKQFGNIPIMLRSCYEIQNHLMLPGQDLNIAIPTKDQPKEIFQYLAGLDAKKYEQYAFRDASKPEKEVFFSNAENRIRYENIILEKGLYIINQIKGQTNPNLRPLGLINPNYRTFGLGTHFFTWRNIPNNCPLVYWWSVPGHNWKPLFPPKRS